MIILIDSITNPPRSSVLDPFSPSMLVDFSISKAIIDRPPMNLPNA